MTHTIQMSILRTALAASLAGSALLLAGCGKPATETSAGSAATATAAQASSFATPEEAVAALVAALQKGDVPAAAALLGGGAEDLLESGDPVADAADRADFIAAYQAKNAIVDGAGGAKTLVIGPNDRELPVPLVQRDGRWVFDGEAGIDEMIYRRVGANELGAIDVMYGFVNAQAEYASQGRDGDPPGIYALKLLSDPGLHNGLYWETAEGEPASPAGAFVASAAAEGYRRSEARVPYHGYYYRMLYRQGTNANGGVRDYFKDGLLTQGFALIAWPADYGSSGVMTFKVNQDGVVFQKDLGAETAAAVEAINTFDPDSSWTAIAPPVAEQAEAVTEPAAASAG
jgi:hypothetical protein